VSFLYPAFLIGALAIAIPIALHLMRRDVAPEVPFTAVRLLRRSPVERSRRRRLRDFLLLAARVAALLLLAAAFARPYVSGAADAGMRIVAIDRSFSMSAGDQFVRARELARAAIDEGGSEPVALVAFDDRADVVTGPGSASDARAAVGGLTPGFGGTAYAPLVDRAMATAGSAGGTLVVVSDLQRSGWGGTQPLKLPPGWRVEVRDVGAPAGNLAVVAAAVEPDRVVATVRNAWTAARQGELRLAHDGRLLASARFDAAPASAIDVVIPARIPESGALAIALDDPGGFAADDTRHLVLGGRSQPRALVIASDGGGRKPGFYMSRALETAPGERGFAVAVTTGAALSRAAAGRLSESSVVVLLATRGLDRRAREAVAAHVRGGGGLVATAAPDLEPSVLSSIFGWPAPRLGGDVHDALLTFAATDLRHPIFRPFGPLVANLGQVRFTRVWRVAPEGWSVLARFSDGSPALLERTEGAGRVLLFASDVNRNWNDFPLHPSFVPFVIETARHAAGDRVPVREFSVSTAPAGVPRQPGVYTVEEGRRQIAVNADATESDAARLTIDEFRRMLAVADGDPPATRLQAEQTEAGQSYWRYGLMVMLAALVAESFLGRVR
jgi:hypothetical protein